MTLHKSIVVLGIIGVVAVAFVVLHRVTPPETFPLLPGATTTPAMPNSIGINTSDTATDATPVVTISSPSEGALLTDAEWKDILTPKQYSVLREAGTEYPYTSDLLHETRSGTYVTADCGEPVFRSEKKFDSGTGWPSFYEPIADSVVIKEDTALGMTREEVVTPICHSHLGHLFHDAPQTPTGDRYCINGVALRFIPDPGQ